MATKTRAKIDVKQPEVDILSRIDIDRMRGIVTKTYQPSYAVMEADGITQAKNEMGQPKYEPADAHAFSVVITMSDPAGLQRLQALEVGSTARIVGATLASQGITKTADEIRNIAITLIQNDQGFDSAMTAEGETLKENLLKRWDELALLDPLPSVWERQQMLANEFGVRVGNMPGMDGPFV